MNFNKRFKNHTYTWTGTDALSQRCRGEINAPSLTLAKYQLLQKGISPLIINKKKFAFQLFHPYKKISDLKIAAFFRQLATLLKSGIPLVESFEILLRGQSDNVFANLLFAIKKNIEEGLSLAESFRKQGKVFDDFLCHLTEVGEKTGTLDVILERIANYKEHSQSLKTNIIHALTYPCVIMLFALLITLGMLIFIVPRFEELFGNSHKLPEFTLRVFHLSHFIRQQFLTLIISIFFSAMLIINLKHFPLLKNFNHLLSYKIPKLGDIFKKLTLARFAKSLATILSAGLPITDGLNLQKKMSTNYLFQQAIGDIHQSLLMGNRLHDAMCTNTFFTPFMNQMIKVGEESGRLESMLEKIAEFYTLEIDSSINKFSKLIEPLIIIMLGVLIGALVIAMYLPIFNLGNLI